MRPDDRFPVMSITKTMVATTVLQLVAAELLRLDDTVEDVVPGLLPQGQRITIRDLLSHRSGLYDLGDDLPPLSRMTDDTLIDAAAAQPLAFPPGTTGSYSNVSYEVLGRVVEQVTGKSLGEAMKHSVIDPAGMSDTQLLGSPSVQGYYDSKAVENPYLRFASAAAGVVSTVADIDRFYTALWRGDLLDQDLVATMTEPLGIVAPEGMEYGLGVWFNPESAARAWATAVLAPGSPPRRGRSPMQTVRLWSWSTTATARASPTPSRRPHSATDDTHSRAAHRSSTETRIDERE